MHSRPLLKTVLGMGMGDRERRKEGRTEDSSVSHCLQPSTETLWCLVLQQKLALELGEAFPVSPGISMVFSTKPCGNQFIPLAPPPPAFCQMLAGKLNQEAGGGGGGGVEAGRNWEEWAEKLEVLDTEEEGFD